MSRALVLLVVGLWALGAAPDALAQAANPFAPGSRPAASSAQMSQIGQPEVELSLYQRAKATFKRVQSNVHRSMNTTLGEIKDDRSQHALFAGIVFAFLYGAFHAAGPGHGKAVVVSYFLSRHARVLRGFLMGAQISFFHVLSAIAIIAVAHFVLTGFYGAQLAEAPEIKYASYGLIVAIGTFMLLQKLTGWFQHSHAHHHHPHHDDEVEDHLHLHQHHGRAQTTVLSFVVGLVPCSGSILIMVYALANGILLQGLVMTIFIAVGMTLTMAALGMVAIIARDRVLQLMDDRNTPYKVLRHGLEILGPLFIVGVGGILLISV
jgi:ABC-type nickel/cobalt efflux system permease component RcnA